MTDAEFETWIREIAEKSGPKSPQSDAVRCVGEVLRRGRYGLGTRYDKPISSIERYEHEVGDLVGFVRINPIIGPAAVWDLVHEFGHSKIEPAPPGCDRATRLRIEGAAWEKGWSELMLLADHLGSSVQEFQVRRDFCLAFYRMLTGDSVRPKLGKGPQLGWRIDSITDEGVASCSRLNDPSTTHDFELVDLEHWEQGLGSLATR